MLCGDGQKCGNMIIKLSEKGFSSELDLFIAQFILQLLCLKEHESAVITFNTYIQNHPKILMSQPPFLLPLLNFVFYLLKVIETGKLQMFKTLRELYKPSIDRDPTYNKCLDKIAEIFFGVQQTQQRIGPSGIIGDMLMNLFNDNSSTTAVTPSPSAQTTPSKPLLPKRSQTATATATSASASASIPSISNAFPDFLLPVLRDVAAMAARTNAHMQASAGARAAATTAVATAPPAATVTTAATTESRPVSNDAAHEECDDTSNDVELD